MPINFSATVVGLMNINIFPLATLYGTELIMAINSS